MIRLPFFWIMMVVSGTWANRLGRYDDDYLEDGYLRSGKKYSPNMHSYQAGGDYNERYADTDRYIARNLQKTPDYRRNDDNDNRDDHSGAYKSGGGHWMGQHYPAKSTYIKPTPASSTTCPAFTTPSCVTVTASTTISRLVSICQLPTTYAYTGTGGTVSTVDPVTGTCDLMALPSKLLPDCCSGPSAASSSVPCFTTTFVRTVLRDKTCTMNVETILLQDVVIGFDGQMTKSDDQTSFAVILASTCAL